MRHVLFALAIATAAAGCNPCLAVCDHMATEAKACGYTVTPADIKTCKADVSAKNLAKGDRQACAKEGDTDSIDANWGCDELKSYFGSSGVDTATQ